MDEAYTKESIYKFPFNTCVLAQWPQITVSSVIDVETLITLDVVSLLRLDEKLLKRYIIKNRFTIKKDYNQKQSFL